MSSRMDSEWIFVSLLPDSSPYFVIEKNPNLNSNLVKADFPY